MAALRPVPRRPELDALRSSLATAVHGAAVTTVDLPPLTAEGVGALASSAVGTSPDPRLRAYLDRCGGNPLLVVEVAAWVVNLAVVT